jgi:hypothetical protein
MSCRKNAFHIRHLCAVAALLVGAALTLGSASAWADQRSQEAESGYSPYYTGAFVEYAMRAGPNFATSAAYEGWHLDLGVRHSFPMLIGDFRLAYRFDRLTETDGSTPGPIDSHNLGGHLALHPAYLLLLGNDWLSYTLASLYLELGAGAKFDVLDSRATGDFESHFGPWVSLGGGLDIPLWDVDKGYAPWLNIVYRWHVADFDGDVETYDLNMHLVQVGLGWRINGLLF